MLFQFPKYLFRLRYLVSKICSHSSLVSGGQVLSRRLLVDAVTRADCILPFMDKYFLLAELHIMVV